MPRTHSRIETARQLRRAIAKLSPASPITDRFSAQWRRLEKRRGRQQERNTVWYEKQHEHWLEWLREYDGPGAYGRADWDRTAGFVHNHIVNPQVLVYLAEASNIGRALLAEATKRALSRGGSMSSMSAAIRSVIQWPAVAAALCGPALRTSV